MNIPIAIKTHKRAAEIQEKTLKFLAECGVDSSRVYLFVSTEEQRDIYSRIGGEFRHAVVLCKEPGLKCVCETIKRYFPPGTRVVAMDDDIESMWKLSFKDGKKVLEPFKDLDHFLAHAFEACFATRTLLWGIYPVHNPFFMSDEVTTNLRFIWAGIYGFISEGQEAPEIRFCPKDDFENTLDIFTRYGSVIRYNNYTVKTKFSAPGGAMASEGDVFAAHLRAAEGLKSAYPGLVQLRKKKGFGGMDVRLVDPKKGEEPEPSASEPKKDTDPTPSLL